jgi:hypothetical protein
MKPAFALNLSPDGIVLLHRAAGGWSSIGEVALDSETLADDLAYLRMVAQGLEPKGIAT